MPAGRPIEYQPDIVGRAKQYLIECVDELYKNQVQKVNLPSIEGLAVYLNIHKDTIYDWEKKYPEFSDVISQVRAEQAQKLINQGLAGNYNPTIAKVLLTKHGYSDKQEIDHTSAGMPIFQVSKEIADKNGIDTQ